MTSSNHWNEITEIFSTLVELDTALRTKQLESLRQTHPSIAAEVELLLSAHENADEEFLEASPIAKLLTKTTASLPRPELVPIGQILNGFEIIALLGEGSFASVYLAKDLNLNRMIALKVSQLRGYEARTMASLEHEHVVTVFSEVIDHQKSLRLICMQYVAGITLRKALDSLQESRDHSSFSQTILDTLEKGVTHPSAFSAALARDSQTFAGMTREAASAWVGWRLALAIEHAHGQGVLHLDVKPENILLSQSAKPFLVDFNVASSTQHKSNPDAEESNVYGGTLHYMSPEQKEAFMSRSRSGFSQLDARSDIYSLGLVLRELYTGHSQIRDRYDFEVDTRLLGIIDRAANEDISKRFATAKEFADALNAYLDFSKVEAAMPKAGFITKFCQKRPFTGIGLMILGPQVIGALINIFYNDFRVLGHYSNVQKLIFREVIGFWNPPLFIIASLALALFYWPLHRDYFSNETATHSANNLKELRMRALNFPKFIIIVTSVCWLAAFALFSFVIHNFVAPLDSASWLHLFISFFMSGIVAVTYSFLFTKFFTIRVFYVRLLAFTKDAKQIATHELARSMSHVTFFHVLAGIIPLLAAILLISVGPSDLMFKDYGFFKTLLFILIIAGSFGFMLALRISMNLQNVIFAIKGHGRKQV